MSQHNGVIGPKFAIGDFAHFSGIRAFDGKILDRRWNPRAYLGHDGIGGWQYLIKGDERPGFWCNERVLIPASPPTAPGA